MQGDEGGPVLIGGEFFGIILRALSEKPRKSKHPTILGSLVLRLHPHDGRIQRIINGPAKKVEKHDVSESRRPSIHSN